LYTNIALYVAGEKFDVAALKTLAKKKYESLLPTTWNSASFITSLSLLYAETPESDRVLKDVAVKVAASHVKELVKSNGFIELCKENGEIGADALKACFLSDVGQADQANQSARGGTPATERRCPYCGSYLRRVPVHPFIFGGDNNEYRYSNCDYHCS
jgi:hypothetical protein